MSIRALCGGVLMLCLALGATRPAGAVSVVEPIALGNWRTEPGTFALGAGAAIVALSVDIVPAFEYVFEDGGTDWAIDLDAHLPVLALPLVALYMGGGVAMYSHNPGHGDSSTKTGADALFGAKASIRRLKPFAEIRYTTAGPDGVTLMFGTRFHLFD